MAKVGTHVPKSRPFRGPLAQPIKLKIFSPSRLGFSGEQANQKNAESAASELRTLFSKLEMLFEHFKITKTGNAGEDYKLLSMRPALEFVPGFQLATDEDGKGRGRPSRDHRDYMRLLADVEIVKRQMRMLEDDPLCGDTRTSLRQRALHTGVSV